MSMKVLFNRTSRVVRTLEASGVLLSTLYFWRKFSPAGSGLDPTTIFLAFLVACYIFIRACDLIDWYPQRKRLAGEPERIGIRVHFQKALVPTSYILFITAMAALWDIPVVSITIVILADLMMLVIAPVNGIQIYFHLRDKDPLPMNHFSLNQHKNDPHEETRETLPKRQATCC
jgi:hypothetical protein